MGMKFYDQRGVPEKRGNVGSKILKRTLEEIGSTATLAGMGYAFASVMDYSFYKAVRESLYNARHSGRTTKEIFTGGPEGKKAIEALQEGNKTLLEANEALKVRYMSEMAIIDRMVDTYRQNETLGRELERLGVQIKGLAVNATAALDSAANKVTGNVFKSIDDFLMGKHAKDAREKLPELQELFEKARKAYDAKEKMDTTYKDLAGYLQRMGLEVVKENKNVEMDLNRMILQHEETYRVEDEVFALNDKVSFLKALIGRKVETLTRQNINDLEKSVRDYREGVDKLRTDIEEHTGIPPYETPAAWIESINPLMIGIGLGLATKGVTTFLYAIPGLGDSVRKVLALPVTLPLKGVSKLGNWGFRKAKGGIERLKKFKYSGKAGDKE